MSEAKPYPSGSCRLCSWPPGFKKGITIQYHHVVPRDLGGGDVDDNIIPLCTLCHHEITNRHPAYVTALLNTLTDAEYAYAVGKAGEDVWERVYGIRYSR